VPQNSIGGEEKLKKFSSVIDSQRRMKETAFAARKPNKIQYTGKCFERT